jgi:hypothetical protein
MRSELGALSDGEPGLSVKPAIVLKIDQVAIKRNLSIRTTG